MPSSFIQEPLFQLSPTRDFADVFILVALLCLVRLYERDEDRGNRAWWLVLLGMTVFVGTGSKGSALPILLGALLCVGLYLLVSRTLRRRDFLPVGVFALTAAVSYFTVLPDPGLTEALTISPFSFLIPTTIHRLGTSVEIVVLLGIGALGLWLVIGRSGPGRWISATLLGGLLVTGVAGLALTNYPGDSQLYFWQSAQPVLAIAFAWALALLVARYRWRVAIVIVIIAGGGTGLWIITQRVWLTELGVGAVALVAALYFSFSRRFWDSDGSSFPRLSRIVTILGSGVVLVLCAQAIAPPAAASGGQTAKATDPSAISSGQLDALTYIRLHSAADDEVITNKHCRSGSVATTCDPHWFAVAAFSERRVLVDGWAYTQNGSSEAWVKSRLDQSDEFINHPTAAAEKSLVAAGVKFVYVDTREPYNAHLGTVAYEVFSGAGARVYELR